ncbi:MAG: hypothetical protein ACAI38_08145 [Myxococcota bacterium]
MKTKAIGCGPMSVVSSETEKKPSSYKQARCKAAAVLYRVYGGTEAAKAAFATAVALLNQAGDKKMLVIVRGMLKDVAKLPDDAAIDFCRAGADMLRSCE